MIILMQMINDIILMIFCNAMCIIIITANAMW